MEQPDRILHKLYQAANDAEIWLDASHDISELVKGGPVHLLLASLETGDTYVNLFARGDPGMADEYLHNYAGMDFRTSRVMARTLGDFIDEREYVSEEEARASVIHQEFLPRYDIHKISGSNMCLDGCIGWFGISTKSASDEFESRHREFLKWLSPHVLNAFRIAKTQHELETRINPCGLSRRPCLKPDCGFAVG
ncbi:hypothetical protein EET67_24950 [Pseudaminobacter arsenicus]|uniref:Uncharacterized protein n=1 Tax=Borborobacter arsenicus TaxID=1851146 RepID=A0A432UZ22_9HYPH|nr:hypothetical protein [Pseudaminobacter arsenicus]RUM95143.1 hypothetical protein EET67_24950 [Pseudaminobacter arsenicus]